MSYILDALKKSEEERHQGEVPNLGMNTTLIYNKRKTVSVWPWIIGVLLLLNLFFVIYWFLYLKENTSQDSENSTHIAQEEAVASGVYLSQDSTSYNNQEAPALSANERPISEPVERPALNVSASEYTQVAESLRAVGSVVSSSMPTSNLDEAEPDDSKYLQSISSEEPYVIRPKSGGRTYVPKANEHIPALSEVEANAGFEVSEAANSSEVKMATKLDDNGYQQENIQQDVPHISDKSVGFQRRVPDMTFNSHIFTTSRESRRVMINNIYLREGQSFSGMVVNEVTEDGVVLSLDGESFKIGVLRNWSAKR